MSHRTNAYIPAPMAALAAAGTLLIAACSGDDAEPDVTTTTEPTTVEPTATSTVVATATATPTVEPQPTDTVTATAEPPTDEEPPSDEAPFPADRARDPSTASDDARLSPVDLRFGFHEDYDRIVLDVEGTGSPGWSSEYVDEPTQQGSGQPVELEGDAALVTTVQGVVYPTEDGAEEYRGPERFEPDPAGIVEEVVYGPVFEGQVEIYVGLDSDQPFRVFGLEDPTRVVIDIQHP